MVNYRASQPHLNTPKYAGDFKQQIHLNHTLHNSGNYLATCIYERVKQGEKNQPSCVQSLDVVNRRGKDKIYVFTKLPFKKCKGYSGEEKKKGGDGIRETYFTGGKAILILITRVKAIHVFYTWKVGNFILLPESLRVRPNPLRKGNLLKLSLPSLTKYCLPNYPRDALHTSCCVPVPAPELRNYLSLETPRLQTHWSDCKRLPSAEALVFSLTGIAIPVPIRGIEDGNGNSTNITCLLTPDRFHDFILYGSVASFFIPLAIMIVTYLLTIQVLRKKAYLINKPPQRFTWSTVSTVFQRDTTPASSPEKVAMLNGSRKDQTLSSDIPIGRTSTIGRKSMQTITNEQRASKVLGIVFFLFLLMWCPFFITNISSVLCNSCSKEVFQKLLEIFVWIGYVSSGVNPLVYTLFNKTFREAFSRYITCNYRTTKPIKALRQRSSRISFRSSVAENSKLFVMNGMRNGINPIMYQSPMRLRSSPIQASSAILLDTLLLTENEVDKTEEQVSYV